MNWLSTADMDIAWCGANCKVHPSECDTLPYLGVCTVDVYNQANTPEQRGEVVTALLRVHKHDQGDTLHMLGFGGEVLLTLNSFIDGHGHIIRCILACDGITIRGKVVQDEIGLTWETYELR